MSSGGLWSRDADSVVPSVFCRGPWDPGLLHGGAVGALLAEVGQEAMDPALQPVRLTVDLLKPVPLRPMAVEVAVVRTGRRLQLLSVGLRFGDALVASASLLALRPVAFDARDVNPAPLPPADGPDDAPPSPWGDDPEAESFVGGGQEFRFLAPTELGSGVAWFRLRRPVFDGRAPSPLARAAAASDVGGAVSARRGDGFPDVSFVNADISVHLARRPEGEWIRLAASSRWEGSGIGFVDSDLSDAAGRFGSANQALVLERRS